MRMIKQDGQCNFAGVIEDSHVQSQYLCTLNIMLVSHPPPPPPVPIPSTCVVIMRFTCGFQLRVFNKIACRTTMLLETFIAVVIAAGSLYTLTDAAPTLDNPSLHNVAEKQSYFPVNSLFSDYFKCL